MIRSFQTNSKKLIPWSMAGKPLEEIYKGYWKIDCGVVKAEPVKIPHITKEETDKHMRFWTISYKVVETLPKRGEHGVVYLIRDKSLLDVFDEYTWIDGWVHIGRTSTETPHTLTAERKGHPTNCVNCGAALKSNKCEYCGTEYL